ncbi:MAG: B12-binding domain-containing radical SAM protein [Candidatus Omnitrophica bacterium]|nr:B12-binding domain-containing radical SAM protein [Candidatus Omnitrophota bacterium]
MKIIISYPPIESTKGTPLLSQNRQFQYFKEPTYIYPIVPATAATLLKKAGYQVIWNDCIAQGWSYQEFINFIKEEKPDLIAFETKTPVVKQHWRVIDDLKKLTTDKWRPLTVLFGDHVSALPEESFQNSKVDFVLTGGDYDFLLLNLCHALSKHKLSFNDTEPGIYYRENGQVKNTGQFKLNHDLNSLPFIERELTHWQLYAYKNGNYKLTPGTYIMSGRDCWWHRCTFCSWPLLYPEFRVRKVDNVLDEIGILIEKYHIREIMDDTGTFPVGDWLRDFCSGVIKREYNKKIYLDCNMRFGALNQEEYKLMKKANFRLILFGLESANQKTLNRINKNLKVEEIIESCKAARCAGLFPHITIMFGYPWESYEEALNTWKLGKWLLQKGYAHTMQATVVIPYPGSPLFEECASKKLLKTLNWEDYDMKHLVMRTEVPEEKIMSLVQSMYKVSFSPEFVIRKLLSLRDKEDLKYSIRAAKKVMGHIFDFSK